MAKITKSIKPNEETILIGSKEETSYLETIIVTNIGIDTTFTIKQGTLNDKVNPITYLHYNNTILNNETIYINLYITLDRDTYIFVSSLNNEVIFKVIS